MDYRAHELTRCLALDLHNAEIMLIGEGPGFHEDKQALPFVGASGKFLTQMLNDGGIPRESVFITNVVKCRPPDNRDPLPEELAGMQRFPG